MTYPATQSTPAREYAQGCADGERWADEDAGNYEPASYWLETFRAEVETFRGMSRGAYAYYLGALRGYRGRVRTQDTRGRWGT